jgi:hypothetical protein
VLVLHHRKWRRGRAEIAAGGGADRRSAKIAAAPYGSIARSAPLGVALHSPVGRGFCGRLAPRRELSWSDGGERGCWGTPPASGAGLRSLPAKQHAPKVRPLTASLVAVSIYAAIASFAISGASPWSISTTLHQPATRDIRGAGWASCSMSSILSSQHRSTMQPSGQSILPAICHESPRGMVTRAPASRGRLLTCSRLFGPGRTAPVHGFGSRSLRTAGGSTTLATAPGAYRFRLSCWSSMRHGEVRASATCCISTSQWVVRAVATTWGGPRVRDY